MTKGIGRTPAAKPPPSSRISTAAIEASMTPPTVHNQKRRNAWLWCDSSEFNCALTAGSAQISSKQSAVISIMVQIPQVRLGRSQGSVQRRPRRTDPKGSGWRAQRQGEGEACALARGAVDI